jgi:hypothetical protein
MGYIIKPPFSIKDKIPDEELALLTSAKHTSEKIKTSDNAKNIKLFILKGKFLNLLYWEYIILIPVR